jgi:hypothetical protein
VECVAEESLLDVSSTNIEVRLDDGLMKVSRGKCEGFRQGSGTNGLLEPSFNNQT